MNILHDVPLWFDIVFKTMIILALICFGGLISLIVKQVKPLFIFVIVFTSVHSISITIMLFFCDISVEQFGDILQIISGIVIGMMCVYTFIDMLRTGFFKKLFRG